VTSLSNERSVKYVWPVQKVVELTIDAIRGIESALFLSPSADHSPQLAIIEGLSIETSYFGFLFGLINGLIDDKYYVPR
jgi:hypothetical protein